MERISHPKYQRHFLSKWVFNPKKKQFEFYDKDAWLEYEIPLMNLNDSAKILDWIIQIHHKGWATPRVFHDFVDALDYVCGGIQKLYCSFGNSKRVVRETLERNTIGWRIFPKPRFRFQRRKGKLLGEPMDREPKWAAESERICKAVFGNK
jgi:hypothetical protein